MNQIKQKDNSGSLNAPRNNRIRNLMPKINTKKSQDMKIKSQEVYGILFEFFIVLRNWASFELGILELGIFGAYLWNLVSLEFGIFELGIIET